MYYSVDSGPKFTGRNRSRSHVFPIFDILSRSGDISDQSRKLCKIDRKFSGGKIFLGEDPPNFWTCIKKLTHMLITVQSFAAIGRRSSEVLCLVKKIKKYGAEPNMRPPGAPSPTGNTICGASRACKI